MTQRQTFMGIPVMIASQYEIERARTYGRRIEGKDGDLTVVAFEYDGNIYFVEEAISNGEPTRS